MAGNRSDLSDIFKDILGTKDSPVSRVYFQPPPSIVLQYPCIIYERSNRADFYSNNNLYLGLNAYSVTVIDKNPDSLIPDKIRELQYCSFSSHFEVDGLNHDVFTLYF